MIRKLDTRIINQIAAGEVVERPSSVLKELVENSVDAGAKNIEVRIVDGGKSLIQVKDDGCGIHENELHLAVERHATSKLSDNDLFNINTFGFRGEALASICSVARVTIKSKKCGEVDAFQLSCDGKNIDISPTVLISGTCVTVRDLFFATPARLKFLKSTNYESEACLQAILNLSLSLPNISFRYFDNDKEKLSLESAPGRKERAIQIFGYEFAENTEYFVEEKNGVKVSGFFGVPNYNKSSSVHQKFFVNGRFVKDKILSSAVRNAYRDVIPTGRYPVCLIFVELQNDAVDVNVHPAKTEVRFRDSQSIMNTIFSITKSSINNRIGQRASSPSIRLGLTIVKNEVAQKNAISSCNYKRDYVSANSMIAAKYENSIHKGTTSNKSLEIPQNSFCNNHNVMLFPVVCGAKSNEHVLDDALVEQDNYVQNVDRKSCYGNAVAQVAGAYIVAQREDELLIIDQHAVCERMLLEKLLRRESIASQQLLVPELIHIPAADVDLVLENSELLNMLGISFEKISADLIRVNGIPEVMTGSDPNDIMIDIIDELKQCCNLSSFEEKIRMIYATTACHRSIRAGKVLNEAEMNEILQQMSQYENIAQCCHGRPSYIKFTESDIKKLFER